MVLDFFGVRPKPIMKLYSGEHLIPLILCVLFVYIIYKKREFFMSWRYEKYFRYFLAIFMMICEISIIIWRSMTNTFDITHTLPLHLCSFSGLFIEIVLLTKNKRIMDYIYYISISGAFVAMFYPDLRYGYQQFRYWEFFVFHVLIVVSSFYMVFVHNLIPSKYSAFKGLLTVHILAIPITILNTIIGGSYMMLVNTSVPLLVELFGKWPNYLLGLELLLLFLFSINYVITYYLIYNNKKFINESV